MSKDKLEFGIVGLGKMGENLSLQALEKGFKVVGNDTRGVSVKLKKAGIVEADQLKDFITELKRPRIVFVYVPAGPVVDDVIDELAEVMEKDDLIVDGGNSYWGDSRRRYDRLRDKNIRFIDLGTSGGTDGARNGACFMAGGEKESVELVEPILLKLAVEGGYVHAGGPGTGHFVKLVHNGIEFGMLQAIGEGMDLLKRYNEDMNIADVLHCWRNGSVIRSWLIDLMEEVYRSQNGMDGIPAYVEDTGEVNWLVNDALKMEVSIPVISQSVMQLINSRDDEKYWARAIAMMRHGFGGHPFGSDKGIVRERREGQVGGFPGDKLN